MNSEEAFLVCNGAIGRPESAAIGVTVLAVDSDSVCLAIVSEMLYASGYRVITATNAAEAMSILREKEDEIDLILTEIHLPGLDKYELLERMRETSNIPLVILSADDDDNAMLGCLFKGATFYLLKPITMNEIRNLWQFAKIKKHEESEDSERSTICEGGSPPFNLSNEELDSTSFSSSLEQNALKRTRKELEEERDDEVDIDYSPSPKKPKLNWTGEMHLKFVQAIRALGIGNADPRQILEHMNVPGLKKENISSHLQEYRLYLKREQYAMGRTVADIPPFNFHDKTFEFSKPQLSMTRNREFYVQNQNNLSWSIDSPPGQYDEDHSTFSSESNVTKSCNNEDQGIFNQATANFGFEGAIESELLGDFSQKQQKFSLPPLSPLVWEKQSNDMFDAAMGDFEHLFGGTDFFF